MLVGFFVNLTKASLTWDEGISTEKMPSDWPVDSLLGHFLD